MGPEPHYLDMWGSENFDQAHVETFELVTSGGLPQLRWLQNLMAPTAFV